ncbi:MAG TPA: hypothetical protein VFI92_02040 [Steroidobacteraceae bacterium]|nr:hypothetical protein [Steroidobacteraceae bacterium]
MNTQGIRHLITAFALTAVLAPVAFAEPPADKGKAANASQPVSKDHDPARAGDGNRGQVVSECNHRANAKELKGKERTEYVEWCTDRGERYQYDDRHYTEDRSCYRKADDRGLSGDFRRVFIQDCLRKQEKNR